MVVARFAKNMIGNIFSNLGEIPTALNHKLQGHFDQAAIDTRSQLLFLDDMIMGDKYLFVREAYLQLRAEEVGEAGSVEAAFEEY